MTNHIADAAKKCAMYASGMPEGSEFVRVFASIIRAALAERDAQVLAALRAATAVVNARDCLDGTREHKAIRDLRSTLSAPHVAAMLSIRNAAASDAGTGRDTPKG